MCFSPQRRAIFRHRNFQNCSETVSFLAFSLQNALLATAACNFLFLLWPRDSAPAALTSLLFDSPDTRIIGKTQRFATSLTFGAGVSSFFWLSRYCIFFLLTLLHLLTLLSSDFISSICFSSAFQLSILSEVYYLNFLRLYCLFIPISITNNYLRFPSSLLYHSMLNLKYFQKPPMAPVTAKTCIISTKPTGQWPEELGNSHGEFSHRMMWVENQRWYVCWKKNLEKTWVGSHKLNHHLYCTWYIAHLD